MGVGRLLRRPWDVIKIELRFAQGPGMRGSSLRCTLP
jgi:hypothetical protein